ncbi:hypothetical protein OF83DRAFT_1047400, partial [Amylostereum chailletii]
ETDLVAATKAVHGYEPRPWQLKVAMKILEGNNIIAVAGTGAGKSLVFSLLAIATELANFNGTVIVICPLKALQLDQ